MEPKVIESRMGHHVTRLCLKNLRSSRVKCCAACPFEAFIVSHDPRLSVLFEAKRRELSDV